MVIPYAYTCMVCTIRVWYKYAYGTEQRDCTVQFGKSYLGDFIMMNSLTICVPYLLIIVLIFSSSDSKGLLVQYLIQNACFAGQAFYVTPGYLIIIIIIILMQGALSLWILLYTDKNML